MKTLLVVVVLAVLCSNADAQTWTLVFSDEFNAAAGTPPDGSKWVYDNPNAGASNRELQIYCGQAGAGQSGDCLGWIDNAQQDGQGRLVISAIRRPSGQWTSARLNTSNRFMPTYGRIEARIRLPFANGLWPAFWMLGFNIGSVGWPACGEQDVMENVPQLTASVIQSSLHGTGYSGGNSVFAKRTFPNGGRVDTGFHVYGVIWSPNQIQYYVDDWTRPFATFSPASLPSGAPWAFNGHPFFLLLNLAVGGNWPTPPDASTPNPAQMLVDYVRVYQQPAGISPSTWYNVVNRNSGRCLDDANRGTANGTPVQQWACGTGQFNQEWQLQPTDGGFYRILSRNVDAVLDVTGGPGATGNGVKVQLWTFGGGDNQEWRPESLGGGFVRFVARHSGRCLDVPGASMANGVQLQQWDCNGTAAQAFSLAQQP